MTYLSAEEARAVLLAAGIYSDATIPSAVEIGLLVEQLQESIDGWLGRGLEVKTYTETLSSNRSGIVRIDKSPIISVSSVRYYESQLLSATTIPRGAIQITSSWNIGSGIISTGLPCTSFEVVYTAGHDPVPKAAITAMKMLLLRQAKPGADLFDFSSLYSSEKKVSSISLPGGLSKSFASDSGGKSASGAQDGTVLDKILTPLLSRYRTTLRFV